jgi:hypothetical protein
LNEKFNNESCKRLKIKTINMEDFELFLKNIFYFYGSGWINQPVTWSVFLEKKGSLGKLYPCKKCSIEARQLQWYYFRTNNNSWGCLAGSEGYYSKCPNCNNYIERIVTICN